MKINFPKLIISTTFPEVEHCATILIEGDNNIINRSDGSYKNYP